MTSLPDAAHLKPLVLAVDAGEIRAEALERILDRLLEEPASSAADVLAPFRAREEDERELEQRLEKVAERAGALVGKSLDAVTRWAMGEVMPHFLGRLEPSRIHERIREIIREAVPETGI